jgi:hypothetical protein
MKKDLIEFLKADYHNYVHDFPNHEMETIYDDVYENTKGEKSYILKKSLRTEFEFPKSENLEETMKSIILSENKRSDWVDRPDLVDCYTTPYIKMVESYQDGDRLFYYDMFPYLPIMSGRAGLIILNSEDKIKYHHLMVMS